MSERSKVGIIGRFRIQVFRRGILIRDDGFRANKVIDEGLNALRDIVGLYELPPSAIAFGTDGSTPENDDEGVISEVWRAEIDRRTRPRLGAIRLQAHILEDDANGNTLREAALVNSTTAMSGTSLCRFIFDDIDKTIDDSVTGTWELEFQRIE